MSTFEEAKKAVINGKKAYRLSQVWLSSNPFNDTIERSIARLCVFDKDTEKECYRLQRDDWQDKLMLDDFEATDWVIE